jgi:protein-tyrosine-phosphatase
MAEAIFKDLLEDKGIEKDIQVLSAGTMAIEGQKAAENAIMVMKEKNIDLTSHSSTLLTKESIDKADIILTMTRSHKSQILRALPEVKNKVFTLKEFAEYDKNLDILDPFGQNIETYRECANEIEKTLERVLDKLKD